MKVFATGGSGFVGTHLCRFLLNNGHSVIATGTSTHHKSLRHKNFEYICTDTTEPGDWQDRLGNTDVVVNLAGRSILQRWTESYKQQILDSRILATRNIVDALADNAKTVLCSASAVGFYGDRGDEDIDENSPPGNGFLAEVGVQWEQEAFKAKEKGIRVVVFRLGVVLGKDGGAMAKMIPAFKMRVGGPLGSGKQWFPWIHVDDVTAALLFLLQQESLQGVFNFTAAQPVQNRVFAETLGKVLRVPAAMPTPRFMVRLVLGEVASSLFDSQKVVPKNLLENGYTFKFPKLESAIRNIVE